MSKKRRRELPTVDTRLVEIYEDLANEDQDVRLKAAQALLSHLSPSNHSTEADVEKAVRRLFRGLCSGRKAARLGFSIALTELLSQLFPGTKGVNLYTGLTIGKIFDILTAVTEPTGKISGQEERDHHFGRLFGAEAVLKSSVLLQSDVSVDKWTELMDIIFALATKKPWLREECGWVVYRAMLELPSKVHDDKYAQAVVDRLKSHQLARTPEGVAIWILSQRSFPSIVFPKHIWQHEDPLNAKDQQILTRVLKQESQPDEESKPPTSGNWAQRPHFVWGVVFQELYEADTKKLKQAKSKRLRFEEFWETVIDGMYTPNLNSCLKSLLLILAAGLFAASSSEERKYWGFQLVNQVVQDAPSQFATSVFSKNVVRCLINQLVQEDRYLHRMAGKTIKTIQRRAASDPMFGAAVIRALIGPFGVVNFDKITRTKTIEKVLSQGGHDLLSSVEQDVKILVTNPRGNEKDAVIQRQAVADYLVSTLRAQALSKDNSGGENLEVLANKIISILIQFGFFTDPSAVPPISQTTQEMFRSRVMSSLNVLMGPAVGLNTMAYEVVRMIRQKRDKDPSFRFIVDFDDVTSDAINEARHAMKKIKKMEDSASDHSAQPLLLLYSLTMLQCYNGDPDAVALFEELKSCFNQLKQRVSLGTREDDAGSEILVEILLSFASKPSKLFSRISEQVFQSFADRIGAAGLQHLLNVLDARESLAGQQELFDAQDIGDNDEDIADDDDDDDDDESASDVDVEEMDLDEIDGDKPQESTSSSQNSGADDDDAATDPELTAFESKLAAALGTHRGDEDLNASDHESHSDEDMDDDQMEALDGKLVEIFQAKQTALSSSSSARKKKEKKDAKEMMITFKGRVLGLLEVYVKSQPSNGRFLLLLLIVPLLRLIRHTHTKHLADKACHLIRLMSKTSFKGGGGGGGGSGKDKETPVHLLNQEDPESAWPILADVHRLAAMGGSNAFTSACSQASLLIVKALLARRDDSRRQQQQQQQQAIIVRVVDLYAATRKRQLTDKTCHVHPSFFTDWNNWCVSFSASQQLRSSGRPDVNVHTP